MLKLLAGVLPFAGALLVPGPVIAADAERVCDHSAGTLYASPDKRWTASVQEEVCSAGKRAAAGVMVSLLEGDSPDSAKRVLNVAVPRTRDEWPRVKWLDAQHLEIWVPNLAHVVQSVAELQGIQVSLKYCGDSADDRQRVADYQQAVKDWQRDVTAWVARRKEDAEKAGPRPDRPQDPRVANTTCPAAEFPATGTRS